MRRYLFALASLVLAAAPTPAQIIRSRVRTIEPPAWVSFGAGLVQSFTVVDGSTSSRWEFGNSTQYGASLERTISGGTTFGLRGSTSKVPLHYRQVIGGDGIVETDADANVSQLFGTLHVASGAGFHTVLELSAGATLYSNFRARGGGSRLEPTSPDADFSFVFGYGFGYTVSRSFSVDVVQDLATTLHQKTGLGAGDDSSVRMHGTRLVARLGLGG